MKKINLKLLIFFVIIAIAVGKIVRYTIMTENLVQEGIGWSMINYINNGNVKFGLTIKSENPNNIIRSSDNASAIFSFINFLKLDSYYGFEIFISIIWNIILIVLLFRTKRKNFTVFETVFIFASFSVLNIFDFCLAKEPIQMIYFILLYFALTRRNTLKRKVTSSIIIMTLSTITFRNYYALLILFFAFIFIVFEFYILKKEKLKINDVILIFVILTILYVILLNVFKIISSSTFNELIRVRLRMSSAKSDIRSVFMSDNLFLFSIDYLIMIFRMMFPIELLRLGPKYLIYCIYQFFISYMILKSIREIKTYDSTRKLAIYIFLAFLLMSTTFEPDFGSWIRHEAVTFPIMLIIVNVSEKEKDSDLRNTL